MRAGVIICATLAVAACGTRQLPHPSTGPTSARAEPADGPQSEPVDPPAVPRRAVVRRVLGSSVADRLRSFVGKHDNQTSSVALAMAILPAIGARTDPALRAVTTGDELMAIANRRNAVARPGEVPSLGDLLVFRYREQGKDVTLAGIVIEVRASDGTIEFLYLNNDVLRRGFANRSHPAEKRDAEGNVLNTFLRIHDTSHSHSRGLAGTILCAHLRLDRLSTPAASGERAASPEQANLRLGASPQRLLRQPPTAP